MPGFVASGNNITLSQVVQDAAGDTFVVGSFSGTATIDGASISSTPGAAGSGFVAKINADGSLGWTQVLGGATGDPAYGDRGTAITVSADGLNVYVGATFYGTFNLPGGGAMSAANLGNSNGALLELNGATGATDWHMQLGGVNAGTHTFSSLALDGAGNLYASGGMYDLNGQTGVARADTLVDGTGATISSLTSNTSAAGQGLYVLKASATTGAVSWATPVNTAAGDISGSAVAADASGHVYMVGQGYSIQFGANGGNTAHSSSYGYGGFIAQVDASTGAFGATQLLSSDAVNVNGTSYASSVSINAVAIDAAGNAVVAGSYGDGAKLTPGSSTTQTGLATSSTSFSGYVYVYGESRTFVEKFDPTLTSQWLATEGGTTGSTLRHDTPAGIVVTGAGSVVVAGTLNGNTGGTSQFGATAINSPGGGSEGFAWALSDSTGSTVGAGGFASGQDTSVVSIAPSASGGYVAGVGASNSTDVDPLGAPDIVNPGGPGFIAADSSAPPCFARGSRIATARGEVAVEALEVGDLVVTAAGARRPIVWIGHREVDVTRHRWPMEVLPVRVRAHAFGDGLPRRDLVLSPQHAVWVDGALIPVIRLSNGATIVQEKAACVSYWHVELESHDVLLAEGLPAESFLDCGSRSGFANNDGFVELHPTFAPQSWADACAPLHEAGPLVEATRARLAARAEALGYRRTGEADAHIVADGRAIPATRDADGAYRFQLPQGVRSAALVSRSLRPADKGLADRRRLGVVVHALACDGVAYPLDALGAGWHAVERDGERMWRWSDGEAQLPLAREIVIRLGQAKAYWVRSEEPQRACA